MNEEHTRQLWKDYPILYQGRRKSISESLIPFGFECGDGWFWPVRDLSALLEAVNIERAKDGIQIVATQVKEKYGTLHFYYGVVLTKPSWWRRVLAAPVNALAWLFNTEFRPEKTNVHKNERGFDTWDMVWHPRWRYAIFSALNKIAEWIEYATIRWREREVLMTATNLVAERLVAQAEERCFEVCEECGSQIGTEWSPRCETQGWITYICRSCAEKQKSVYSMKTGKTGKIKYFQHGKDVTKEYQDQLEKTKVRKTATEKKKTKKEE